MDIYCQVTDQGLVPMYESDYDEKKRLKLGDTVLCTIRKPRNYEFHKKFFALVRLCYQNLPEWMEQDLGIHSEEDMLISMKLDLGLAEIVRINGRPIAKTASISFAAMDNTEFERFYNRCVDLVLTRYLCGTGKQALLDEIINFK